MAHHSKSFLNVTVRTLEISEKRMRQLTKTKWRHGDDLASGKRKELDSWSLENTTHLIIGVTTALLTSLKNRVTWIGILESMKERCIVLQNRSPPSMRWAILLASKNKLFLVALLVTKRLILFINDQLPCDCCFFFFLFCFFVFLLPWLHELLWLLICYWSYSRAAADSLVIEVLTTLYILSISICSLMIRLRLPRGI